MQASIWRRVETERHVASGPGPDLVVVIDERTFAEPRLALLLDPAWPLPTFFPFCHHHARTEAMPDQSPLPLATSLDEVYTPAALAHEGERWNNLFDAFQKEYGVDAKHLKVSRAPGRVNIIGAPFPRRYPLRRSLGLAPTPGSNGASGFPINARRDRLSLTHTSARLQESTSTTAASRSSPPLSSATSSSLSQRPTRTLRSRAQTSPRRMQRARRRLFCATSRASSRRPASRSTSRATAPTSLSPRITTGPPTSLPAPRAS